jgi:hypothetical protein
MAGDETGFVIYIEVCLRKQRRCREDYRAGRPCVLPLLKVVGNEKQWGSGRRQMLGIVVSDRGD